MSKKGKLMLAHLRNEAGTIETRRSAYKCSIVVQLLRTKEKGMCARDVGNALGISRRTALRWLMFALRAEVITYEVGASRVHVWKVLL